MPLLHKKFRLPERCNAREVVVRETNGIDEQHAALQADVRGRTTIYAELVRLSVVEVDGKAVVQPFIELDQWNSVSRSLVMKAYQTMNDLQDEEIAVFLSGAEDATPGSLKSVRGDSQTTG